MVSAGSATRKAMKVKPVLEHSLSVPVTLLLAPASPQFCQARKTEQRHPRLELQLTVIPVERLGLELSAMQFSQLLQDAFRDSKQFQAHHHASVSRRPWESQ